jgi:membrane fusion protein, heavy metal efflux system
MGHLALPHPMPWFQLSLLACACLLGSPAQAAPNKPAGCLIEPEQVADVGSPVTGIIEELGVALDDTVQTGQALVKLRADVERANAHVALARAQVDAEVRAAQANLDLARQKVRRNQQLVDQSFVSAQALEQALAEAEVAAQKLKLAQSQQKIYAREESVAQAQLGLRTLRSPIKGVIVERFNNLGERVEDKPVVRVAAIDPLRVSLMVPIAQYGQVNVGYAMVIRPELPGAEAVRATVTYVDKVVDAASNSFRVRLSLPNPGNKLPGGLRCKADWNTLAAATPAAPATPATPPAGSAAPTGMAPAGKGLARPSLASLQAEPPAQAQPPAAAMAAASPVLAAPIALSLKTAYTLSPNSEARIASRLAQAHATMARMAQLRQRVARWAAAASAKPVPATAHAQLSPGLAANRLSTILTLASAN